MAKSREFVWDCWMEVVFILLTKKSHKIHSIQESIKIDRLLNSKRQLTSHEKSQLNTNRIGCPEKKLLIVLIEYHKIFLYFIKVLIEYHHTFSLLKSLLKSLEITIQYTPLSS